MNSKELDYESALIKLQILISQVRDPYLQFEFNNWINTFLHKAEVSYTSCLEHEKQIPTEYIEHHIKGLLKNKLLEEASTVAKTKENEYLGYPFTKIRTLSMIILGRKNETK